ncbi:CLUMA_CG001884, isoform A [Clunio marinus]|uniref:CLUMA_CG001884, isoform A n=1 Tax=Clunio marinus TaxID=568069 RepID=A0A1J1HJL1_9DIPT|nr:CLUMA_CG001884, isoform A [Clunio marinus]
MIGHLFDSGFELKNATYWSTDSTPSGCIGAIQKSAIRIREFARLVRRASLDFFFTLGANETAVYLWCC